MLVTFALWMTLPAVVVIVDDPPRMVEGVARIAGTDRPAAGMTLRVFDQEDPKSVVVTDDQGRFRAPVPAGQFIPALEDQGDRRCWAEAEVRGRWTVEPIDAPPFRQSSERLRHAVAEGLTRPAEATWRRGVLHVECPEPGEVDVLVRGPDGAPLASQAIQVVPDVGVFQSFGPANARFSGRTDAAGRFRMRWFDGPRRFHVSVPGQGFGTTPPIVVAPGKTTTGSTWLLARFGSIEGRLAPKLVGPGIDVVLDPETQKPTPVDEAGRFLIREVPPGRHVLRLTKKDHQSVQAGQLTIWVAPGQKVEGLVVDELPPPTPEVIEMNRRTLEQLNGRRGESDKDEPWVDGTVRDASGKAMAGVDVFVRTAYHGGMRMYEDVRQATTDAKGHYAIQGKVHGFIEPLAVVARFNGRPLALANAEARSTRNDQASTLDITMADSGGSASVTVLKEGQPRNGLTVRLEPEGGANIHFGHSWARSTTGPAKASLDTLLAPTATTDRNGVARFTDLLPGLYVAYAADDPGGVAAMQRGFFRETNHQVGEFHGLAVATGREARVKLAIAKVDLTAKFQVIRPDGKPVTEQSISLQVGLGGRTNMSTNLKLNAKGIGEHTFDSAGLWTVVARFLDAPVNFIPIEGEPYYEAEATVPVSPALRDSAPIRLVGAHREGGTLLVRLLDVEGRPARGVVDFDPSYTRNETVAATDERGEARLEGLAAAKYYVRAHLDRPTPPPWAQAGPIPPDDALRGRFELVPGTEVTVPRGRVTTLELRAKPLGYIRGSLKPPNGHGTADYAVVPWFDLRSLYPNWRYDTETGEFLAGPFPAGPTTIQLSTKFQADGSSQNCGRQVVEVVAGEVTHVELRPGEPEESDRSPARQRTMLGMGGVTVNAGAPETAPFTVFLPDGKTPAFGAQAILYVPRLAQATSHAIADASGRLTWRGLGTISDGEDELKTGLVTKPTMVVSLPGRHGATIVPLEEGQHRRVVLPPPIDLEGKVTIAGRPSSVDGSIVRVEAEFQGRGVLNSALSLQATVEPGGRFQLSGLTPGVYQVQAARDGIWASKSTELRIEADKIPPPLTLDIPAPGEPVTLEFVDHAGRPLAGESFTLERPQGPLGSSWPKTLHADPQGRLTLRGLEAGPHAVSIAGTTEEAKFRAGELPEGSPTPVVKRLILQRPGP